MLHSNHLRKKHMTKTERISEFLFGRKSYREEENLLLFGKEQRTQSEVSKRSMRALACLSLIIFLIIGCFAATMTFYPQAQALSSYEEHLESRRQLLMEETAQRDTFPPPPEDDEVEHEEKTKLMTEYPEQEMNMQAHQRHQEYAMKEEVLEEIREKYEDFKEFVQHLVEQFDSQVILSVIKKEFYPKRDDQKYLQWLSQISERIKPEYLDWPQKDWMEEHGEEDGQPIHDE